MIKKIFLISLLFFFLLPPSVIAENGLLPCGPGTTKPSCGICDLFVLITNVLNFVMTRIVPVVATLMLIIGGIWFYFSGASPENKRRAQSIVTSSVIGVVIILTAWAVVNTILDKSGIVEMDGWKWYDIECGVNEEIE